MLVDDQRPSPPNGKQSLAANREADPKVLIVAGQHGANALGLQRVLGLGQYRTAWTWLHKLRRAMVRPGRERLVGTAGTDEIDVGGKKVGACGRLLGKKAVVAVAVEENEAGIGRVRLKRVPNAAAASLEACLLEAVEPGSTIRTDGWRCCSRLQELGYRHDKAVMGGDGELVERMFPRVHRVAAVLKRWLLGARRSAGTWTATWTNSLPASMVGPPAPTACCSTDCDGRR